MAKDIKTKDKSEKIKTLNRKFIYTRNMKDRLLRRNKIYRDKDKNEDTNEINYAIDKVSLNGRDASIHSAYVIKDTAKNVYRKLRSYREKRKKEEEDISTGNSEKTPDILKEKDKEKAVKNLNRDKLLKSESKKISAEYSYGNKTSNSANLVMNQQAMKEYSVKRIKNNGANMCSKIKDTTKSGIKAVSKFIKKLIVSLKSLTVILVSGGNLALIIIIIALIVAGMFGSAFGLLFSNETPSTEENMSVNTAVKFLEEEIDFEISKIKESEDYDTIRIENRDVSWREVLSVYAVITTNRENTFNIMNMDKSNYDKLSEMFWKITEIEHYIEKYTVKVVTTDSNGNKVTKTKTKKRLVINVICMSLDEMMDLYEMNKSERKQIVEMMNEQFDDMWSGIFREYN